MEECFICKKKSNFNGCVNLHENGKYTDINLCRSHYLRFCKSKGCQNVKKKYKNAKPATEKWYKYCEEEQKIFDNWIEKEIQMQKHFGGKLLKKEGGEK